MMRTCNLPVTSDQERGGQMAGSEAECMQGVSPRRHSAEMTPNTIESGWSIENYIDVFMSRNLAEV